MEGNGFNQSEVVKHLSEKFAVSERAVYYDFEKRGEWQPTLLQLQDRDAVLRKVVNRYEQIYRKASFKFLQSQNENVQLGALKVMVEANNRLFNSTALVEVAREVEELKRDVEKVVRCRR